MSSSSAAAHGFCVLPRSCAAATAFSGKVAAAAARSLEIDSPSLERGCEIGRMPVTGRPSRIRRRGELFGHVSPQELVKLVASDSSAVEEGLVGQSHQIAQGRANYLLRRLSRKAAAKDGQSLLDPSQLGLPADKRREWSGQVMRWQVGQRKAFLAVADAMIEGRRLFFWLDTQFCFQGAATRFVVNQRRVALTGRGQDAHHLPVDLFLPRFQLHDTPRTPQRTLAFTAQLVAAGQTAKGVHSEKMIPFLLQHHPLLKGGAAVQRKALKKTSPVEIYSLV
jgi:hypothetical protein